VTLTADFIGDGLRMPFTGGEIIVEPADVFDPPNTFKLTIRRYRGGDSSVFLPPSAFHMLAEFTKEDA